MHVCIFLSISGERSVSKTRGQRTESIPPAHTSFKELAAIRQANDHDKVTDNIDPQLARADLAASAPTAPAGDAGEARMSSSSPWDEPIVLHGRLRLRPLSPEPDAGAPRAAACMLSGALGPEPDAGDSQREQGLDAEPAVGARDPSVVAVWLLRYSTASQHARH